MASSSSSSSSSQNPTDGVTTAASPADSPAGSPLPLPLPAPPPPLPSSTSSRRPPPPCWAHEETLALIDSYREKWYSLHRGNLRAGHWQEVADAVSSRCHRLPVATPKTSVQCRHKVEKLRKRYRAERQRFLSQDPSTPPTSSWAYFRKMDAMERGGSTASRPSPSLSPAAASPNYDDESNEDDANGRGGGGTARRAHRPMENGGGIGGLRFRIPKAVRSKVVGSRAEERAARSPSPSPNHNQRSFWGFGGAKPGVEEMRGRGEKKRRDREGYVVGEMVTALRMLGDGFMRIEQTKMEMARKMEKVRMEMELKRTEMILDSQRQIVDSVVKGFMAKKRAKASPDS